MALRFRLFILTVMIAGSSMEKIMNMEVVDMTYEFANDTTIYWPTAQSFELFVKSNGMTDKGYWYASNDLLASEHGGTHIDAPVHFSKGQWTVEQIPLKNLITKAVVIDIKEKAATNPDAQVTSDDLMKWEEKNGRIIDGSIVLMNSGWGRHWNNRTAYLGTSTKNTSLLHFPGFAPEAARWLANSRNIVAVGVDTPSLDYGQSTLFEVHVELFKKNIYGLENVANLDQIPITGAVLHVNPMKIKGGTGGPARILAIWNTSTNNANTCVAGVSLLILSIIIFLMTSNV